MSSHREAPEISKDPVADSTDLYAFVSPDQPDTVTLIANYIPLEAPDGGPNFYEFGDDVLYEIHIDNDGDADADITFQFRFNSVLNNPNTFFYNTGPIESLDSPNWNRRQFYSVTVVDHGRPQQIASGLPCPPCRIGPLSTHNYGDLADAAVNDLPGGIKVFAGQRAEGFYVDLGAIFDLGDLRPFEQLHNTFGLNLPGLSKPAPGVNATKSVNVHSIAIQVPSSTLTANGQNPTDPTNPLSTIGVWTTASRQQARVMSADNDQPGLGRSFRAGLAPGQPARERGPHSAREEGLLEHAVPGRRQPVRELRHEPGARRTSQRAVPGCLPEPGGVRRRRDSPVPDLAAILLTGIPPGVVPGIPELHGSDASRLAPTEHGHSRRRLQAQQSRVDRRRRGGLPERAPCVRRRRDDRAACHRRRDLASRRQDLHARRRRGARDGRADLGRPRHDGRGDRELPLLVPVPRSPAQRLREPRRMTVLAEARSGGGGPCSVTLTCVSRRCSKSVATREP